MDATPTPTPPGPPTLGKTQTFSPAPIPVAAAPVGTPLPAKVQNQKRQPQKAAPASAPQTPPPGWWSLRNLSGSLAGVTAAVNAAADIPTGWKTAIVADLQTRVTGDYNFVYLDVHCVVEKGNVIIHYSAAPDTKLL